MLAEFGREMGFEVKVYPEMKLRGESVSSSQIRKLMASRAREPGAASPGASILHFGDAWPRARIWIEVHGADDQSGAL